MSEERYCLGLLAEEMGESLQLIGKALRFGMDTPGVKRLDGTVDMEQTPRTMLAVEIGDLLAGIDFAKLHDLFDYAACETARSRKLNKLTNPASRDNLGRPLAPQPDLLQSPSQPVVAEAVRPDGWLVERLQGEGYGKPRKVIDARQHAASSDDFWTSPEAKARHRITPLYVHPQASPPPVQGEVTQADREAAASFYQEHLARPGEVPVAAAMRMRHIDDSPLIQAFRAHRLAHSQPDTQEGEAIALEAEIASLKERLAASGG